MSLKRFAVWLGLGASAFGMAGPLTYAGKSQPINAGVLLIGSQVRSGERFSPTPHAFTQLARDRSVKPAAWSLRNPRANSILTATVQSRWNNLGGSVPPAGTTISKLDAPYWEVNLPEISAEQLSDYDVLLLSVSGTVSLSPIEREKLRQFVDGGGLLWVDILPTGPSFDLVNVLPIPFGYDEVTGGTLYADYNHPLLNLPNRVSVNEIASVQAGVAGYITPLNSQGVLQSWIAADTLKWQPVVGADNDQITIGLSAIGEGYMMVTTRGLSTWLNEGFAAGSRTANQTYRTDGTTNSAQFATAAKIFVNAMTLASQYGSEARGSRRTSSLTAEVSAPLFRSFKTDFVPSSDSSAIYKGRIVMTVGNQVVVLDAKPNNDRDLDGNPDDGLADPLGSPYDVLWISEPLSGPLSNPTCTESVRASVNEVVRDKVFVQQATGGVVQFDLDPSGVPLDQVPAEIAFNAPSAPDSGGFPAAPVVHEGMIYVADTFNNLGRLWAIDLANETVMQSVNRWTIGQAARIGPIASTPTIGYIPIRDNSGGMDKVMYVPGRAESPRVAGISSVWLGARGESPFALSQSGSVLTVTTRAALSNLPIYLPAGDSPLGVKISVVDANGNPYSAAQVNSWFSTITVGGQNGVLNIGLTGAGAGITWSGNTNFGIRIDYTLDWGANGFGGSNGDVFVRGDVQFPEDPLETRGIQGNIALAKNGNLFVVTAPTDPNSNGGTLWALQEFGRGDFRVLYRWECHDRISFQVQGGANSTIDYDPCVIDQDGLLQLIPFLSLRQQDLRITGGPVVRGDTVYISVVGRKSFGFAPPPGLPRYVTNVVALDANPNALQMEIAGLNTASFALLQPDITRSTNKAAPTTLTVLNNNQLTYERENGFGVIRLETSSTGTRGRLRDVIACNLPVIIRQSNASDLVVEPELTAGNIVTKAGQTTPFVPGNANGRWNPQRWQMTVNGLNVTSRMSATGDILYFAGGSYLPQILQSAGSGFPDFSRQDGMLYALNTRIGPNDIKTPSEVKPYQSNQATVRTWQKYVSTLERGAGTFIIPSQYVLMPNPFGIRSFDDLRVRVRQSVLDTATVDGMVAGDSSVIAWGQGGLGARSTIFRQGDIMVADEGRILRVDTIGNPIWASDSTGSQGESMPTGFAESTVNLSKPSRVYASGQNGYLIADPGNNRIMEVDQSGREQRTITRIKVDPNYLPDNAPDNMVKSLSGPNDVYTFNSFVAAANNPFTNPQPNEFWIHYVIADTGNGRVVELVDRYEYNAARRVIGSVVEYADPTSSRPNNREKALGVLNWHISASIAKKRYAFNSIGHTVYRDNLGNVRTIYAYGFGNREASNASFGLDSPAGPVPDNNAGTGGIALIDPSTGASKIISEFQFPGIGPNKLWNPATGSFNSPATQPETRHLHGLKSVTLSYVDSVAGPTLAVMFTDSTGVYELIDPDNDGNWDVRWCLPRDVYRVMRRAVVSGNVVPTAKNPADFFPAFARRLESGEVLIANSYVGRYRFEGPVVSSFGISAGDPFTGEVILLNGDLNANPAIAGFDWNKTNLGFDSFLVNFELPPVQGVRGLVAPTFADKR